MSLYHYSFNAEFISGMIVSADTHQFAINNAVAQYNAVIRSKYKNLSASINSTGGLSFELDSEISIEPDNLLRSIQFFSKCLSTEAIMEKYIKPNRLLISC